MEWVHQQIRAATPYGLFPRFLHHDNDGVYGQLTQRHLRLQGIRSGRSYRCTVDCWRNQVMGIRGLPLPCGALNSNPHIERFFRELREECLRHFLFFSSSASPSCDARSTNSLTITTGAGFTKGYEGSPPRNRERWHRRGCRRQALRFKSKRYPISVA